MSAELASTCMEIIVGLTKSLINLAQTRAVVVAPV
jgi:hypothetical protein